MALFMATQSVVAIRIPGIFLHLLFVLVDILKIVKIGVVTCKYDAELEEFKWLDSTG